MSSIMNLIGPERIELSALDLDVIPMFNVIYRLTSTNINQSAPQYVKIYDYKKLDNLKYGSNLIRATGVICTYIKKKKCSI